MASSLFFSREGKEEETVSARETKHRSTGARFRGVRGETSIETKKLLPAGQIGERSSLVLRENGNDIPTNVDALERRR